MQKRLRVFKYLEKEHANSFSKGVVKINTFDRIRKYEKAEIGDAEEGISTHKIIDIDLNNDEESDHKAKILLDAMMFGTAPKGGRIKNSSITYILPNAWLFCVTKERNDEYWASLDNPYDACFYINDFSKFVARCVDKLFQKHQSSIEWGVADCLYENNIATVDLKERLKPFYFRKTCSYQSQKEIRAVFIPRFKENINITTEFIQIEIRDLITRVL